MSAAQQPRTNVSQDLEVSGKKLYVAVIGAIVLSNGVSSVADPAYALGGCGPTVIATVLAIASLVVGTKARACGARDSSPSGYGAAPNGISEDFRLGYGGLVGCTVVNLIPFKH